MSVGIRAAALRAIAAASQTINRLVLFRRTAQASHDAVLRLLRNLDDMPLSAAIASALHRLTYTDTSTEVGGARLSQRLILAAGLVKGDGFADEAEAMRAAAERGRNIMPGWRIVPALVGAVEFGSFTRHPRLGNPGTVVWRKAASLSTQNRVGLRNPGARAAACFLGDRRSQLPNEFGINIAVSPGLENVEEQTRDVVEALSFFLVAGVNPTWFTLNLSCPNTEDDPQGLQLEAETRQICGAIVERLRSEQREIPLWIKLSPGLATQQYAKLLRVSNEVGVRAIVATNTSPRSSPNDLDLQAGIGGGELYSEALHAVRQLQVERQRGDYAVDVIACGGILDGSSLRTYEQLGVRAAQYWSALVFRGPFAAAIIESELAEHENKVATVNSESFA